MARIAFFTWGSLGDLHPYLALAVELGRRGHAVSIATLGAWRPNVEAAGVEFRALRPDVAPHDPDAREIVRRILDPRGGPPYLFRNVFAPSIRETYADTLEAAHGADLLVSHQVPQTTPIVAEQTGVRWVSGACCCRWRSCRPTIPRRRRRRHGCAASRRSTRRSDAR